MVVPSYPLYVQVSGLNQQTIELRNTLKLGQEELLTVHRDGLYRFNTPVSYYGYSVTVANSGSLSCVVKNGAATEVTAPPLVVIVECSGEAQAFSVGGEVSGLTADQLFTVRINPDALPIQISQNGSYQFPTSLPNGETYKVEVVSQTQGLVCHPINGTGVINKANATVNIGCKTVVTEWDVSAEVRGLADGNLLVLHNQQPGHADDVLTFNTNISQPFDRPVPDQGEYMIFIGPESQLNGQTCNVTSGNSTGRASSPITVQVQCLDPAPTSFPISVNVTGLYEGNQVVVQETRSTQWLTLTSAKPQDTFEHPIGRDQPYSVQIVTLPTLQACEVTNGSDKVGGPVRVQVTCGEPVITVVYSTPLPNGNDPYYGYPVGLIQGVDGYFYGITTRPDVLWANDDRKTQAASVFKMDPNNPSDIQVVGKFQGASCVANFLSDGKGTGGVVPPSPTGIIQIRSGELLGTTFGGALPVVIDDGTKYFDECAGTNPIGNLRFRGTFFGYANNDFNQFLYQIGDREHQATAIQNAGPVSGLTQDKDGNVYGITYGLVFAGTTAKSTQQSVGTVFQWTKEGQSPLYVFNSGSSGFYPSGKLMRDGQYLYGTTERGGAEGKDAGTIFRIDLKNSDPQTAFEVVYDFDSTAEPYVRPSRYYIDFMDGDFFIDPYASRYSGLTKGSDGHLYGVRRDGGANGAGAIYRLVANPSKGLNYELLYSFPMGKGTPILELVEINGVFYGTTLSGGDSGFGSIYRFNPITGNVVTIHSFKGSTAKGDGQTPSTALMLGSDGKSLYGATMRGGAHDQGAIYKFTW